MSGPRALVLSCEHASAALPPEWQHLARGQEARLASHQAWDPGALELARRFAKEHQAPLQAGAYTRLLVDLNRSPHNPAVFSSWTRPLPAATRAQLLERYHSPHWAALRELIQTRTRRGEAVLQVACHSFTPVLDGEVREVDVAWLYDPRRRRERAFCDLWRAAVAARDPSLRLRRNHPYRGRSDGLPTALRGELPGSRYIGVELEVNQAIVESPRWAALQVTLCEALREARQGFQESSEAAVR